MTSSSQSSSRSSTVDCSNPQTQQELNQCAVQAYRIADQELQTMYEQMKGQMTDVTRSQLDTSQEEWFEFRAAECRLEAKAHEGGSLYPTAFYRCMERLTRERMEQLQDQIGRQ